MALILANDGIDKKAEADLKALGHEVDTQKYEGDELLARLAQVDCVIVRSATKIRTAQIDAGALENTLKLESLKHFEIVTGTLQLADDDDHPEDCIH